MRERGDDIPLLIEHFVERFARRQGKSIDRIPDEVMEALTRYSWPGNIRELQNFIERSVILTSGSELRAPMADLAKSQIQLDDVRTLEDANRAHIKATLCETKWVVGGPNGAAARLGMHRTTLIAKMQKLGISRETIERSTEVRESYKNVPLSLPMHA